MRKLQINRDADREEIDKLLDEAFGKISNRLSIQDIRDRLKNNPNPFCLRVMSGSKMIITAYESLPKNYKYSKAVAVVELLHNGKVWLFNRAYRTVCYAGKSIGGTVFQFRSDVKDEIIYMLLEENNYSFQYTPPPAHDVSAI
jgi:hypothetical protein